MGDELHVVRDEVWALVTRTSESISSALTATFDTAAPAVSSGMEGAQVGEVCAAVGAAAAAAAKGLSAKLTAMSDKSIVSVDRLVAVDGATTDDLSAVGRVPGERWV